MSIPQLDFVVLIPCYNNKDGLLISLKSIRYTKDKCEVLVVDDGSIDPLEQQALEEEVPALSIKMVRLDKNQGIVHALNAGLKILMTQNHVNYIARLDAGDRCHPERFYKQVAFLDVHPEIALLASWARFQNIHTGYDYITQTEHTAILKEMHYKCSFIHPSVMFRTEVLKSIGLYPINYTHAEDYAFFWSIIKRYKSAVLPEKMVEIVLSDNSISGENYKKQLRTRKRIVKEFGSHWLSKAIGIMLLNGKLILPKWLIRKIKNER